MNPEINLNRRIQADAGLYPISAACGQTVQQSWPKPFVLYREIADHSAPARMIYIGSDKSAALDALLKFFAMHAVYGSEIHMKVAE